MPVLQDIEEFLDLVRKCGAVDLRKLEGLLGQHRNAGTLPDDPESLAELLIDAGLLTRFQAEPLVQGKPRRFLISGKYKLLDRLGAGGMASVYLCEHRIMRRRVAIKILPPSMAKNPSSLERFHREARASAALDHPNIVRAHDVDNDGNMHFLVVEFIDGTNLSDLVKKSGPLAVERACHYVAQTCAGLHAAHVAGLVHRDIKPANLLLDRYGMVKILDLGLALFFHEDEDGLTREHDNNAVLGTADYLAPEQGIDSHGVDIRADIYSLGATFYYLLTGQPPFAGGTVAQKLVWHHMRAVKPVRELRPDIPQEVDDIVMKMMAKDREVRYQTPREVMEALAPFTTRQIALPTESEMPKQLAPLILDAAMSEYNMPSFSLPAAIDYEAPTPKRAPVTDKTEKIQPSKQGPKSSTSNSSVGSASTPTMTAQGEKTAVPVKTGTKAKSSTNNGKAASVSTEEAEGEKSGLKKKKKKIDAARKEAEKKKQTIVMLAVGMGVMAVLAVGIFFWATTKDEDPTNRPDINTIANQNPQKKAPPIPDPILEKKNQPKLNPPKVEKKVEPNVVPPIVKVEPKVEQKVEPKVEPMPMPVVAPPLTADFFFTKQPGDSVFYDASALNKDNQYGVRRLKYDFLADGKIEIAMVRVGGIKSGTLLGGGAIEWGAEGKQKVATLQYRVEGGFVDVAEVDLRKKGNLVWEHVLKLDAKTGDSWPFQLPNGDTRSYTVEKFEKVNNRDTYTIREVQPVPGGEGVTIHTYVRGVGETTRKQTFIPKSAGSAPVPMNPANPQNAPANNEPKLIAELKLVEG